MESPSIREFFSTQGDDLSLETLDFENFLDKKSQNIYKVYDFDEDHVFFGTTRIFQNQREKTYYPNLTEG